MSIALSKEFLESRQFYKFKEPLLDFNVGVSAKINSPILGLQKYGPFDHNIGQRRFNSINFILMIPNTLEYYKKCQKLLEIMQSKQQYFNGFKDEFHLNNAYYPDVSQFITYEIDDIRSIQDTVDHIKREFPDEYSRAADTIPFVLVAGPDYRILKNTPNYDSCKKELLQMGYPNQYLSDYISPNSKITGILNRINDPQVIYPLWNTMVSIYAKSGGIPWTLKNKLNNSIGAIDLVIGFRFAMNRQSEKEGYVVGVASVFGCNGRWRGFHFSKFDFFKKLKVEGLVIPREQMIEFLTEIIRNYKRWELTEEPKSIVLHKLGFFHEDEVSSALSVFDTYDINSYSLLEITTPKAFRLFDVQKLSKCIPRGLASSMSNSTALLCTTGTKSYNWYGNRFKKEELDLGSPKPIIINIKDQKNCFKDSIAVARHIFSLTALHWQYLFRGQTSLPVTLIYAHEIAKNYARDIKPHENLEKTPWFL